jgi:predicted enzyme related to lactoylglutathione lyase
MAEESGRTLVCSVLFIDIVGYSKHAVTEQYGIKRRFNGMLAGAMEVLTRRDRVIVDTGDGAAVVFLGDPEDALVVGVAMRGKATQLSLRMGINLGPVKLIDDLNDQTNVIGDGINVAQRVMSFAEPGQLLVSAHYHDVVSRLSPDYAGLFAREGARQDKHERGYEVWSVSEDLRIGGDDLLPLTDEDQAGLAATGVYRKPAEEAGTPVLAAHEPAKVIDAGQHLMISGSSRASVKAAIDRLIAEGGKLISPVTMVGSKWIAACGHPNAVADVKIEAFGLTRILSGPSRSAVEDKAAEIVALGGKLLRPIEQVDGQWTAVCDTGS